MEESGLFELIRTLTKSEKRYFKRYAVVHTGKDTSPNAVQLFNSFEELEEYDEAIYKNKNKHRDFYKNLASEKQHLGKVLIRSLQEYHKDNSPRSTIRNYLNVFELLFQKRQYKLCEKNLIKALHLCRESENTIYLKEIFRNLGVLYHHSGNNEKLAKLISEIRKEEIEIFSRFKNEYSLSAFEFEAFILTRTIGYPRTGEEKQTYEEHFRSSAELKRQGASLPEQLSLLSIENYYHDMLSDKRQLLKARETWVSKAEQNQKFIKDNSTQYLVALNNLANIYDELSMEKELNHTLDKISSYPAANLDEEVRIFIYYYTLKLLRLINTGRFKECVALFPEAEKGMKKFGRWFHPEYKLSFRYLFLYGHFGAGNYNTSLKWVNEIINHYPEETLERYYHFARVFILIVYFEMGYEDLLISEFRSANRYFSKRKKLFAFERIILQFIKQSLKPEGIKVSVKEYSLLQEEIRKLKNDPYEQQVFIYFDWDNWVEVKIREYNNKFNP